MNLSDAHATSATFTPSSVSMEHSEMTAPDFIIRFNRAEILD